MTKPAAFRACYSDFKLIKTRGCCQFVFEVPIENSDEAYQALGGMPNPAHERWVAIARLNEGEVVASGPRSPEVLNPTTSENGRGQPSPSKRMVRQAAIACADPLFRQYLAHHVINANPQVATEAEAAAQAVRDLCGVASRAEILPNTPAGDKWEDLHGNFLLWKAA